MASATNYKFVAKGHWFPDGLRLLLRDPGPGAERRASFAYERTGQVTSRRYSWREDRRRVAIERWNDPLVGN